MIADEKLNEATIKMFHGMTEEELTEATTRMCQSFGLHCDPQHCPVSLKRNPYQISCIKFESEYPDEFHNAVEQWAKEHPANE